jgi:hypothetical protein
MLNLSLAQIITANDTQTPTKKSINEHGDGDCACEDNTSTAMSADQCNCACDDENQIFTMQGQSDCACEI